MAKPACRPLVYLWVVSGMYVVSVTPLAGCASAAPRYAKSEVAIQDQRRDEAECVKAALGGDGRRPRLFLRIDRDAADQCMIARGYTVRGRP